MEEDPQMTEVHSNLSRTQERPSCAPASVAPAVGKSRRNNAQAIGAGMAVMLSEQRKHHWSDNDGSGGADVLTTAYVPARLGEVPCDLLSDAMRVQVRKALDWLIAARSPNGGWGRAVGAECDAESTAWALMGLRPPQCPDSADYQGAFPFFPQVKFNSLAPGYSHLHLSL